MTREDVLNGLKEIIKDIRPNTDLSKADYQTELVRELGIDSLTMLVLSLAAEEKFRIHFPDGAPAPITVGDVCDSVLKEQG